MLLIHHRRDRPHAVLRPPAVRDHWRSITQVVLNGGALTMNHVIGPSARRPAHPAGHAYTPPELLATIKRPRRHHLGSARWSDVRRQTSNLSSPARLADLGKYPQADCVQCTAASLGPEMTLRPRGRPKLTHRG